MLDGGRIQDHLFYNIQNYYCTILFIGYCAKGTLGHRLLRGDPIVHIKDRDLSVCHHQTNGCPQRPRRHNDLLNTVKELDKAKLKTVFLVHGETVSMQAFADALEEEGYPVTIPEKGVKYELN